MKSVMKVAAVAWLITAVYYFYQYMLRSAPAVMMPELSEAFGLTAMGVASIVSIFYYGYSPFSLVAGVALDQWGPRKVVPLGAAVVGVGALLFATGDAEIATIGRFLQGAGGVFALVGAVYLATKYFPASRAATLIGATQMFGMAGGAAGQFVVGPVMTSGVSWSSYWIAMGCIGIAVAAALLALLPLDARTEQKDGWMKEAAHALATVLHNPQSIFCGLIAGLLFLPTTIFDMIWGVRYLEEAHGFDYSAAVLRSSTVPLGWIVGCPVLGLLSDRIGRRKPIIAWSAVVLLVTLAWILYGSTDVFPPYVLGFVTGVASGAAMLPYTVIKEANPPNMSGTAMGVVNFLNFTLSALFAPVFSNMLTRMSAGDSERTLMHYQATFTPLLFGVALAIVLTFCLRETGPRGPASISGLTPYGQRR